MYEMSYAELHAIVPQKKLFYTLSKRLTVACNLLHCMHSLYTYILCN